MENEPLESKTTPVVFTIDMTQPPARPRTPARLLKYQREHSNISRQDLDDKLAQAEERRKATKVVAVGATVHTAYEQAKLNRIKERTEECCKIDAKVQLLLAQDAKRRGLPGTEKIKPMSTREAVTSIKALSREFTKITMDLGRTEIPK